MTAKRKPSVLTRLRTARRELAESIARETRLREHLTRLRFGIAEQADEARGLANALEAIAGGK